MRGRRACGGRARGRRLKTVSARGAAAAALHAPVPRPVVPVGRVSYTVMMDKLNPAPRLTRGCACVVAVVGALVPALAPAQLAPGRADSARFEAALPPFIGSDAEDR